MYLTFLDQKTITRPERRVFARLRLRLYSTTTTTTATNDANYNDELPGMPQFDSFAFCVGSASREVGIISLASLRFDVDGKADIVDLKYLL